MKRSDVGAVVTMAAGTAMAAAGLMAWTAARSQPVASQEPMIVFERPHVMRHLSARPHVAQRLEIITVPSLAQELELRLAIEQELAGALADGADRRRIRVIVKKQRSRDLTGGGDTP